MSEQAEIKIEGLGITMGSMLCSYLYNDPKVCHAGYQTTRDGNLVIKVQTTSDTAADVCIANTVKKCREDINRLNGILFNQ